MAVEVLRYVHDKVCGSYRVLEGVCANVDLVWSTVLINQCSIFSSYDMFAFDRETNRHCDSSRQPAYVQNEVPLLELEFYAITCSPSTHYDLEPVSGGC